MCKAWPPRRRSKADGRQEKGPDGAGAAGQEGGRSLFLGLCEGKGEEEKLGWL